MTPDRHGCVSREVVIDVVRARERFYQVPRVRIADGLFAPNATGSLVVEADNHTAKEAVVYRRTTGVRLARSNALPLCTFDQKLARIEGVALVGNMTTCARP